MSQYLGIEIDPTLTTHLSIHPQKRDEFLDIVTQAEHNGLHITPKRGEEGHYWIEIKDHSPNHTLIVHKSEGWGFDDPQ